MRKIIKKTTRFAIDEEIQILIKYLMEDIKETDKKYPHLKVINDYDDEIDLYVETKDEIVSLTITNLVFNTGEEFLLYTALLLYEDKTPGDCIDDNGNEFIDPKGNCMSHIMLLKYENNKLIQITEDDLLFVVSDTPFNQISNG